MSTLRKRSDTKTGRYHIEYKDPHTGRRRSKAMGTTVKKIAQEIQREFDQKLAKVHAGILAAADDQTTMTAFLNRLRPHVSTMKSPTTAARDIGVLEAFTAYTGDRRLTSIDRNLIEQYISNRLTQVAPGTVNLELRHLKAAFNVGKEWGLIAANPFVGIKMLRVPESDVPRFLETEHISQLREAVQDDPFRPIILFYLLTGTRLREATSLMGEDIDFRRGLIHIRGSKTKSKRNRSIPFNQVPELRALLEEQKPTKGMPVFRSIKDEQKALEHTTVSHHIRRVFKKLGMPWATTHSLRHTFASHLVMAGVEMWTVSKLLGHSSIAVTEKHYAHLAPKHAEDAMGKLPY